jgi:hypothetical protein
MYPQRVGGISATCVEAFRPYSRVLANLTGVCYWWGWVPTCGLTAILSASATAARQRVLASRARQSALSAEQAWKQLANSNYRDYALRRVRKDHLATVRYRLSQAI